MAAKVRRALPLSSEPAVDELDLVTVLLHTRALRGNRRELAIDKPFLKSGAFHLQQVQTISTANLGEAIWEMRVANENASGAVEHRPAACAPSGHFVRVRPG